MSTSPCRVKLAYHNCSIQVDSKRSTRTSIIPICHRCFLLTINNGARDKKNLFGVPSLNSLGFEVLWDMETLWRHMAFLAWPSFANQYNFSLAYLRLVVFEPIHVVKTVKASNTLCAQPANNKVDTSHDFYPIVLSISEHGITGLCCVTLLRLCNSLQIVNAHFWKIKRAISTVSLTTPVRMLHALFSANKFSQSGEWAAKRSRAT